MALKWKHGVGETKFSENEKRNFASFVLSMLETQINLLAAMVMAAGADKKEYRGNQKTAKCRTDDI
jgi:hypothetical protein